ncbi:MAG: GNAT family N-acetyltransferase [Sulfobacillus sp.]
MGDGTPVAPATGRRRHLEPCGNSPRSRGESNVWREWNSEDNFSRGSSRAVERYDGAKQRGEPVVGHRGQRLSRRHNSSAVKGRYIGHITILGIDLDHRNARLRMGIYERRFWSQGFGREAARCVFRYVFNGLHLHWVSLRVAAYNLRAICSYASCGFVEEES